MDPSFSVQHAGPILYILNGESKMMIQGDLMTHCSQFIGKQNYNCPIRRADGMSQQDTKPFSQSGVR